MTGARSADITWLAALSAAFWVAVALVEPGGDVPLNDDWAYALAVRALVEDGALRFADWQSMPLLTHVLWGAMFASVFGTSHEVLRLATLVAGWLGVLATYGLLRVASAPRRVAAFGAGALLVCPIYFALAHTFMTDVTFVAALVAGAAAWIRYERTGRLGWLALAVALAVAATLDRQLGLALPLGAVVASALKHGLSRRFVVGAAIPLAIVLAAWIGYERAIAATIGLPALYHEKSDALGDALADLARLRGLRYPLERALSALAYLGLFTLPLSVVVIDRRRWPLPAAGLGAGALAAALGATMPLLGNVWIDLGVGPRTMEGELPGAPALIGIVLTMLAGLGAGALLEAARGALARAMEAGREEDRSGPWRQVRQLARGLRADERAWTATLAIAIGLAAFAPSAIVYGAFFDRYALMWLPLAALVLSAGASPPGPSWTRALGAALLGTSLLFSVAATHDYLAWQRARARAIAWLEARGVPREDVRGGFEVDNAGRWTVPLADRSAAPYAIAITPLPDHSELARVAVNAWLPRGVDTILVLRRTPPPRPASASASASPDPREGRR